jgi:hypothetical protein
MVASTGIPVRRLDAAVAPLVFAACLAAYAVTLAPGLPYPAGDSHEFTMSAAELRLARRTGYPLYTWLGALAVRALPFGDAAYRTNLLSALLGAGAVALLHLTGRRIGFAVVPAAAGALAFGVSPTFWSQAVVTEVYAPNAFMLALTLWLLLRWAERPDASRLACVALALGASLGTHLSNLLLAPAYALFVLLHDPGVLRRGRSLVAAGGAFLAGVAQFVWLPLRAGTAQFPNPSPNTLARVWAYTLGAFPALRFAYPLAALPERLAVYASCAFQNFGVLGIALGALGTWTLLARRPAAFWLVIAVYVSSVVPASLSAVPDLEVFFIPAHLAWSLFIGAGVQAVWSGATDGTDRALLRPAAAVLAALWLVVAGGAASFAANDRRRDTAFDDFHRNAFAMLPRGATLLVLPGVFGQGTRYWQHVRGLRSDVRIVESTAVEPRAGTAAYTTLPVTGGRVAPLLRQRGPLLDAWWAPVLAGARHGLVLWRASDTPPPLLVKDDEGVRPRLDRRLAGVVLVAATAEPVRDAPAPRVRLRTWWRVDDAASAPVVSSRLRGGTIESHVLGRGLLEGQRRELGGRLVHEDVELAVPSTTAPGTYEFQVGVTRFAEADMAIEWADVGRVVVD